MTQRRTVPSLFSDAQAVQGPHGDRGIARYVTEHLLALRHAGVRLAAIALNPDAPPPSGRNEALLQLPELAWNTRHTFREAIRGGPLAFHLTSPFESTSSPESLLPRYVREAGVPVVATVYDLIPALFPQRYLASASVRRSYESRLRLLASADLLLAISESSRRDTIELLGVDPTRVHTIGGGVGPFFRPSRPGEDTAVVLHAALPGLRPSFVLTVAGYEPRKNVEGLLASWALLPDDLRRQHQLVVACSLPEAGRRAWEAAARTSGLGDDEVLFTGFVTDEVLRALYQATSLFVFPSEYEGFGLPVAEAIACGASALTSRSSSMPEILDWPGSTFDHSDPADIAEAITRALTDDVFAGELAAASRRAAPHHTWELVAERTVAALATLPAAERRRRGGVAVASSAALVGPLSPSLSGIAAYNSRVVAELEHLCRIDTFVDERPGTAIQLGPHRFPASALGRTCGTGDYDAIVYTIGNSDYHHATLQRLRETPGIAWLHDVHLTGLYFTLARRTGDPRGTMEALLQRSYGRRVPMAFYEGELFDDARYRTGGFRLTAEVGRLAKGIIVNSHLAARLLRLDAAPSVGLPPIAVIPLAFPPVAPLRRRERAIPLLVHLGWIGPSKQPELLVDTLAVVLADRQVELALVGPIEDRAAAELRARAEALGVSDHLTITGALDQADYDRWIDDATLAVQLRSTSNGESSATACEAMAAGLPLVSSIATLHELPAGTVELVDPAIGPVELAATLGALLDDPGARSELARRAWEHAATWTYRHVAEAVLAFAAALDLDPVTPSTEADLEVVAAD